MAAEERSFPLLDSLKSVFSNREIERRKQLEVIKDKEECNKVHVQYLKENVISKQDYDKAGSVVSEWAKRNGISKDTARMLRNKRTTDLIPLSNTTIKRRRLADSPYKERAIKESSNKDWLQSSVVCEIVNCGIVFDSKLEFERHNAGFQHSPCNPYKHLPNGKLLKFPLLYTCPKCTAQFQKEIDCQEHMIFKDHLPVLSPSAICGYMCPQCCMIFHNIVQCHSHMSQTNHYNVTYSFSQDTGEESTTTKSILISVYLAKHFYSKCLLRGYTVKCVTCKDEVNDVISKHQHTLSTGHQQYITNSTCTTDEVFGEFLCDKSCDNCGKIIWNGDVEKGFHGCTSIEIGFLTDIACKTFREFVHRCGLLENIKDNEFDASIQNLDSGQRLVASSTNTASSMIAINSSLGAVGGVDPARKLRNESQASVILLDTPDVGSFESKFLYGSDASLIMLDTPPAGSKLRTESVFIVEKPSVGNNVEASNKEKDITIVPDDEDDDLDYLSIGNSSDYDSDDSDIIFTGSEECKPSVSNWSWNTKSDNVETTSRTVKRSSVSPSKKVIQISQLTESSTVSLSKPAITNDMPSSTETKGISNPNDKNVFNNAHDQEVKKLSKKARYRQKKKLEKEKCLLLEKEKLPESKPSSSKGSNSPVLKQSKDRSRSRSKSPLKPTVHDSQDSSRKHLPKPHPKKQNKTSRGPGTNMKNIPERPLENMDGDISTENLSKMQLLIFLDLDNWTGFFKRLPKCLPDKTFVWTFYGGNTSWKEPKVQPFIKLKRDRCFYLHSQCGKTKDASDFAICFTIGKMDDRLPKNVPFAILSGDRGFCEIENQMKTSSRRTVVIDPHETVKCSEHMLYTLILSVMHS